MENVSQVKQAIVTLFLLLARSKVVEPSLLQLLEELQITLERVIAKTKERRDPISRKHQQADTDQDNPLAKHRTLDKNREEELSITQFLLKMATAAAEAKGAVK